jgi:outer membrane protein OmpA-like peptidoglycan-associated protein
MSTNCNQCGAAIAEGQRFCNSCGAPQLQPVIPATKFCVNCGSPISAGAAFCNKCGATVNEGTSRPQTPAPAEAAVTPEQVGISGTGEPPVASAKVPNEDPAPVTTPPPFTSVPSLAAPINVPASVPPPVQTTGTKGKGCITALIVTLVVMVVIVIAIVGGMIYVAHKVKNKVEQYAKQVQDIGDRLAQPDRNTTGDFSDVPGSFKIGEPPATACPETNAGTETTKETPRVPLKVGLTWVNAWRRFNGDVEVINKVSAVTVDHVDTSSSGLAFSSDKAVHGNQLDTARAVCRADLEDASEYYTEYRASLPHIIPHTTTFSMSQKSLEELKTTGKLTFTYQQFAQAGGRHLPSPRTAELMRVEAEDVNYPVILNGQPTNLPTVHARGHFHFTGAEKVKNLWSDPSVLDGDGELFVLDDPANPMMLQFGFGPVFQIRVVSITFPEDKPKPQIEQQLEKQKKAVIYGIYFDFNEATIKKESQPVLKEIAEAMKNNPDWVLTVNGYTDNIGGDKYNLDLSQRRAAAVKKSLVEQYAIAPERLTTGGFGASSPVDTNDTLEGRARNRRVELIRQ